ncbi:MAG: transcription antitermination factor NusB [Clostridium sp.]|jgi:N utilization substance protein B|nr:transcription antitermination factor NusB [Clostridium sp.]CCZ17834.1 n utilization substance protein B homolog [Clostridium sp. CAG:780]
MEEMTKRELAFCYIYSQEVQKQNSKSQVKLFLDSTEVEDGRAREYVKDIAKGIKENDEEITKIISENLKSGWTIDRISTVDLSLLKLAIYEIKYIKTPYKIIINEVVNMAKKYGEETAGSFINGVLAKVVEKDAI